MTLKEFILENAKTRSEAYKLYNKAIENGLTKASCKTFERTCRDYFQMAELKGDLPTDATEEGEIKRTINPSGEIESEIRSAKLITNVQEMADFCHIDMNDFQPPKIVTNRWANMWQFKVWWIPKYAKNELSPKVAAEEFKELIKDIKPFKSISYIKKITEPRDVIIGLADSHLSSLAWSEESSQPNAKNNDLKIAKDKIYEAMEYYYDYYKHEKVRKIIIPLGNDFFDVNDENNSTVNNTVQSFDNRVRKMFTVGLELMINIISMFNSISNEVYCPYIPANHDMDTSFYLSKAIEQSYKNNKSIFIDARPNDRKYFPVGDSTAIQMLHGKTVGKAIKADRLPAIMMNEARELCGKYEHREILLGHVHHAENMIVKDFNKTIIRIMPTILTPNFWSESNAFASEQQMECYTYGIKGIENIKIYRP